MTTAVPELRPVGPDRMDALSRFDSEVSILSMVRACGLATGAETGVFEDKARVAAKRRIERATDAEMRRRADTVRASSLPMGPGTCAVVGQRWTELQRSYADNAEPTRAGSPASRPSPGPGTVVRGGLSQFVAAERGLGEMALCRVAPPAQIIGAERQLRARTAAALALGPGQLAALAVAAIRSAGPPSPLACEAYRDAWANMVRNGEVPPVPVAPAARPPRARIVPAPTPGDPKGPAPPSPTGPGLKDLQDAVEETQT